MPGEPDKSRLIEAVRFKNVDLQMPPKGKLPDAAIADLIAWVKAGAVWPNDAGARRNALSAFDLAKRKQEHWAWQPVRASAPPVVKDRDWPSGPVDRFILAKLEEKDLKPAPAAERRAWIRRVTFDLIGLPPTPAEVDAFLADTSIGCEGRSRRSAAAFAAVRRALGPALARSRALRRDARPRVRRRRFPTPTSTATT